MTTQTASVVAFEREYWVNVSRMSDSKASMKELLGNPINTKSGLYELQYPTINDLPYDLANSSSAAAEGTPDSLACVMSGSMWYMYDLSIHSEQNETF
jgi:hypothetical protein